LTNFSNDKQIQKSLESDFSKTIFRKTNTALNSFVQLKVLFEKISASLDSTKQIGKRKE
jgi:hypothetical protein